MQFILSSNIKSNKFIANTLLHISITFTLFLACCSACYYSRFVIVTIAYYYLSDTEGLMLTGSKDV